MNFFTKFFKKSSSKEDSKKSESKFLPKKKAVIEERFILKFIENGGKFLYCEDLDEVQDNFNLILKENEWVNDDILIINSDLKKTYNDCVEMVAKVDSIILTLLDFKEKTNETVRNKNQNQNQVRLMVGKVGSSFEV